MKSRRLHGIIKPFHSTALKILQGFDKGKPEYTCQVCAAAADLSGIAGADRQRHKHVSQSPSPAHEAIDHMQTRIGHPALALLPAGLLAATVMLGAPPYRRYIEAGDYAESARTPNTHGSPTIAQFTIEAEPNWVRYELDRVLPPGAYRVMIRAYQDRQRSPSPVLDIMIRLNGAEASLAWPAPTCSQGYQWQEAALRTESEGRDLKLTLTPTREGLKSSAGSKCTIGLLYITADPRDWIQGESQSYQIVLPGMERHVIGRDMGIPPPNYLANGGFEVGWGHNWRLTGTNAGIAVNTEYWLKKDVPEGRRAFRIPWGVRLRSGLHYLESGTYSLATHARSKRARSVRLALYSFDDIRDNRGRVKFAEAVGISHNWKRYSASFDVPAGKYVVSIDGGVDVDAISLSPGDNTVFEKRYPVEIGMITDRIGRAWQLREAKIGTLLVAADESRMGTEDVWYRIVDFFNEVIHEKSVPVKLYRGSGRVDVDLDPNRTGVFRVEIGGGPDIGTDLQEEMTYSIHPDVTHAFSQAEPFVGFFAGFGKHCIPVYRTAGIGFIAALSASRAGDWAYVERQNDSYYWFDKDFQRARDAGLEAFIGLDVRQQLPCWVEKLNSDGSKLRPAQMEVWADFVTKLADHYHRLGVAGYLVLDDPERFFSTDDYLAYLTHAYDSLKAVDERIQVVAWAWMDRPTRNAATDAEKSGILKTIADHSDILYQASAHVAQKLQRPTWRYTFDTTHSMYQHNTVVNNFPAAHLDRRFFADRTARSIQHALRAITRGGATRYLHYNARLPPDSMSVFEYDGSLNPAGVAFSILEHQIRGTSYSQPIMVPDGLTCFRFDAADRVVFAIWSESGDTVSLALPRLTPDVIRLVDIMGNPVPAQPHDNGIALQLSAVPLYIHAPKTQYDLVVSALVFSTVVHSSPVSFSLAATSVPQQLEVVMRFRNTHDATWRGRLHIDPISSVSTLISASSETQIQDVELAAGEDTVFRVPLFYVSEKKLNRDLILQASAGRLSNRFTVPIRAVYVKSMKQEWDLSEERRFYFIVNRFGKDAGQRLNTRFDDIRIDTALYTVCTAENLYLLFDVKRSVPFDDGRHEIRMFFQTAPDLTIEQPDNDRRPVHMTIPLQSGDPTTATLQTDDEPLTVPIYVKAPSEKSRYVQARIPRAAIDHTQADRVYSVIGFNFAYVTVIDQRSVATSWAPWPDPESPTSNGRHFLILEREGTHSDAESSADESSSGPVDSQPEP